MLGFENALLGHALEDGEHGLPKVCHVEQCHKAVGDGTREANVFIAIDDKSAPLG
jgi:hypothetical protein